MPIVTANGFKTAPHAAELGADGSDDAASGIGSRLTLTPDADVADALHDIDRLTMIRVSFPSFADGRGFSIARQLRAGGYTGHLRAVGHVISDQFRYALACGFDDVEISDDLARRQPEADWRAAASNGVTYRERLSEAAG
ncbi:MAG: DUF934 domain-containing protein [Pseudomonadota bacterium]